MKMTRLEWQYLQRITLDHPYYDTHKPPLSDAEARAIMEANNTMTGREFVDSIYAKLGMNRPVREKKHFAWLSNIGELLTVPPIRKIAIAILVVVLMTVFFSATPTGRAIAESVIRYIGTLFNDGSLSVNQSESDASITIIENTGGIKEYEQQDGQTEVVYVNTFDEFIKATRKEPIELPLPYSELYYEYDEIIDYTALYSTYRTHDGMIVAYQIWDVDNSFFSTQSGFSPYNEEGTIYYSIEEETGSIHCIKIMDDSVFSMSSEGDYSLDELISILMDN